MTGDRFARLVEVFDRARQMPESQRERFLLEACGDDEDLLADVRDILDHAPNGDFLEPSEPAAQHEAPRPDRIGPYHLLSVLGEGGMGTVYLARQDSPVRRRVAIKVIKLGMDSASVLARFELERQALASMNHRAIAKVFDAGTTDRGQPFFVMELVEGLPLTHYCDEFRLSIPDRIALFQEVCAGVQHAHQKGVIHRDLKPGNILVVHEGDKPVPKILDFGLAKATDRTALAHTLYTEYEQILGTPEYMSPEQASMSHEAVDTRSDIYSLGVVLYELLCGQLPFTPTELRKGGWRGIQETLSEVEPPRLSSRLAALDERVPDPARRRRTTLPQLVRGLRGDLDWITLKALAKEPERRYDSAAELSLDLRRHLVNEPVHAGPPTTGYRLAKLIRRNRGTVVAGALVAVSTIVGIAAFAYQSALALQRTREFDMLALVVHLDSARAEESTFDPAWPDVVEPMRAWLLDDVGKLREGVGQARRTLSALRAKATPVPGGGWAFASDADRFLHDTLATVVREVEELEADEVEGVRARLLWAENVQNLTIDRYRDRWNAARAAIAAADGVTASTLYARRPIDLVPQLGLVPIGMNPVTKLWEFYHLRSSWDPRSSTHPTELPVPSHEPDGRIEVEDDTGIVFVLVPGGTARIGAQSDDPTGDNYDRWAEPVEGPPHTVELEPFFLARHELSQGQWKRMTDGTNPADYQLRWMKLFKEALRQGPYKLTHPVEEADWNTCTETMRRHGLVLPTEAQWEYACRAGTSWSWWTGPDPESLRRPEPLENLCPVSAEPGTAPWTSMVWSELDDGYALTAPADGMPSNPWGFVHMHGNVSEWCRDHVGSYADPTAPGDGERIAGETNVRVCRGGAFDYAARYARSASRSFLLANANSVSVGLRAARAVMR